MIKTFSKRVASGGDDGFSAGFFNDVWGYAAFGNDGLNDNDAYFRFTNITIPRYAYIHSAIMTLEAWGGDTDLFQVNIYCNDEDSATAPTDLSSHAGKARTTAYAYWNSSQTWVADTEYDTPDFREAVQEVVNRSGWVSGNDLMVLIDNCAGVDDVRKAKCYNSYPNDCALLTIEYSVFVPKVVFVGRGR